MPECPECQEELIHIDNFGRFFQHQDGQTLGCIYKCGNELCNCFDEHFYQHDGDDEIKYGYPC